MKKCQIRYWNVWSWTEKIFVYICIFLCGAATLFAVWCNFMSVFLAILFILKGQILLGLILGLCVISYVWFVKSNLTL